MRGASGQYTPGMAAFVRDPEIYCPSVRRLPAIVRFLSAINLWMGHPSSISLLVDHFGNNSSNPSAAPLGLMLAHCLPWVWFCAPRHLERPPRHRRLWPSRTSLPRPDRSGFIALRTLRSWEGRWRPPEGLPISKLDYLFPIIFQSIQLESSSPTDRWLYIARKNIFVINFWMFKS